MATGLFDNQANRTTFGAGGLSRSYASRTGKKPGYSPLQRDPNTAGTEFGQGALARIATPAAGGTKVGEELSPGATPLGGEPGITALQRVVRTSGASTKPTAGRGTTVTLPDGTKIETTVGELGATGPAMEDQYPGPGGGVGLRTISAQERATGTSYGGDMESQFAPPGGGATTTRPIPEAQRAAMGVSAGPEMEGLAVNAPPGGAQDLDKLARPVNVRSPTFYTDRLNTRVENVKQQTQAALAETQAGIAQAIDAQRRRTAATGGRGFAAAYAGQIQQLDKQGLSELGKTARDAMSSQLEEIGKVYADEAQLQLQERGLELQERSLDAQIKQWGIANGFTQQQIDQAGKQFYEAVRQFDVETQERRRQFDLTTAEGRRQFDEDLKLRTKAQLDQIEQWGINNGFTRDQIELAKDEVALRSHSLDLQTLDSILTTLASADPETFATVFGTVFVPLVKSLNLPGIDGDRLQRNIAQSYPSRRLDALVEQGMSPEKAWAQIKKEVMANSDMAPYFEADWFEKAWDTNYEELYAGSGAGPTGGNIVTIGETFLPSVLSAFVKSTNARTGSPVATEFEVWLQSTGRLSKSDINNWLVSGKNSYPDLMYLDDEELATVAQTVYNSLPEDKKR